MEDDDLYENAVPAGLGDLDDPPETAITGLAMLAERVDRLLRFHEDLERENQALRERNEALQVERDALHDRNEQSRARIEAMIVRLRDLEQTS
ncbi:MAG: TIGR02449 family protein [Candidatus Competibacteraceae bacterium]